MPDQPIEVLGRDAQVGVGRAGIKKSTINGRFSHALDDRCTSTLPRPEASPRSCCSCRSESLKPFALPPPPVAHDERHDEPNGSGSSAHDKP